MKRMVKFLALLLLLSLVGIGVLPVTAQDRFALPLPESFTFHGFGMILVRDLETLPLDLGWTMTGAADRSANALDMTLEGEALQPDGSNVASRAQIRLLNDTLYADFGAGWQSVEGVGEFAADTLSIFALNIDSAALSAWDITGIDGMSAILAALASADASAYLTVERVEDAAVDNVPVVRWNSVIDLPALMRTDAFVEAVSAFAGAQGNQFVAMSPADLAEAVRANADLFTGSTLTLDAYIGVEDGLLHRFKGHLSLLVDPTVQGFTDLPFTVAFLFDITFGDLGQPVAITAPEAAEPVTALAQTGVPSAGVSDDTATRTIYFASIGEGETFSQPFEAASGDTVTIAVRAWGLDFDPNVALVAPDGSVLAENDDYEDNVFFLGGLDSYIGGVAIAESGTYVAEIREFDGLPGGFVLTLSITR